MKTLTIKDNGLFDALGYSKVEIKVPENVGVDDIDGHKGYIELSENLTISDENVLSDVERDYEEGSDINISYRKNTYTFNVPDMHYSDTDIKNYLDQTYNRLLELKKTIDYLYSEDEIMYYSILLNRFLGKSATEE